MGKKGKLIAKLKSNPIDFTFDEMKTLLEALGFVMSNKGDIPVILHKPHPRKELLEYQIKQITEVLEREDLI